MDDSLRKILIEVFTAKDVVVIENMLKVVDRNISESNKAKRVNMLDAIVRGIEDD